jgi:hypothetical protein
LGEVHSRRQASRTTWSGRTENASLIELLSAYGIRWQRGIERSFAAKRRAAMRSGQVWPWSVDSFATPQGTPADKSSANCSHESEKRGAVHHC